MGLVNYDKIISLGLKRINICDLGAGIPKESFNILNKLKKINVSLVDNAIIPQVDSVNFGNYLSSTEYKVEDFKEKYLSVKSNDFLYNEYLIHSLSKSQEYLSLEEFNLIVKKNYEIDAIEYLNNQFNNKFEVMIISKLFANLSYDKKVNIMALIPEVMNPDSLLFIRLNYKGYETMKLIEPHKLNFEDFTKIDEKEEKLNSTRVNKLITFKKHSM